MLIKATDIINQSVELYLKHFKQIWVYLAISLIPTITLTIITLTEISLEVHMVTPKIANDIVLLIVFIAGLILSLWAYLALIKGCDRILKNQLPGDWKENFISAKTIILSGIWLSIIVGLTILAGSILFIIPGIIFTVWFQFSIYSLATDNTKGIEAMKMSKNLVTGRWWAVLWRLFAPSVLFAIAAGILQWIIGQILNLLPTMSLAPSNTVTIFSNNIISLLLLPLLIIAGLILYENLKSTPVNKTAPIS